MMNTCYPPMSERFHAALAYASALHASQLRKSTSIPYIAHLLAVAIIVLEAGGTEDEAIAALLHDGPEDQGGIETLNGIRRRFGTNVADIVEGCSDTFETPKPPWLERKQAYLDHLAKANRSVLLVSAADKLHNSRATLRDLRKDGQAVWKRFSASRDLICENYKNMIAVYESAPRDPRRDLIVKDLRDVVDGLDRSPESAFGDDNALQALNDVVLDRQKSTCVSDGNGDDAPVMSGATHEQIKSWLQLSKKAGACYAIIKADRFFYYYYPVMAFSGRQAIELARTNSVFQKTMEVYDLSLPLEAQLKEDRANHLPDQSRTSLEEDKPSNGSYVDIPGKTFLTKESDSGGERRWHGYPDECYSLTTFADSLVALAYEAVWIVQPPIVDLRNAIVVDFASETEAEAESSLAHGWNGAWELPMGAVSTVIRRTETNEQNARIERHMLFIGTAMMMADFHRNVGEKLLDAHTCADPECSICTQRFSRGLAEAFQILADGTEQGAIHLFAKWKPSKALVDRLAQDGIEIRWHHLSEISKPDLEANRYYSIWDGSVAQASEFLETVWAPAWKTRLP